MFCLLPNGYISKYQHIDIVIIGENRRMNRKSDQIEEQS